MADVFDIAVMGSSLTTWETARDWPNEFAKALQIGKRSKVRAHAMGAPGETSNWGLANVQPLIARRPKVALIEFINDAFMNYQNAPPQNMTLALSVSNFTGIINAIKAGSPGTAIYLMTLVKPTAAAQAALYPSLAAYDAQLATIAASNGVGFIDLRAVWGDPAAYPSEYPPDGVHVYLPAHQRVTIPRLVEVISPLIT
jgi:acyl-CoA thioesterase I